MDFRTQENEMRTSGYGGAHLTKDSSGAEEKRRLGGVVVGNNNIIHNGSPTVLSPYQQEQTLDHHHHHPSLLQPHHLQPVPLSSLSHISTTATKTDPDPDRLGSSTAVAPLPPPAVGHIINKLSSTTKTKSPTATTTSASTTNSSNNVKYRECLKNHAANIGGNVFDGCGEFMPCGEEGTLEALKCAACDCHRNFHRKEVNDETTTFGGGGVVTSSSRSRSIMLSPLQLPPPLPSPNSSMGLHHYHHNRHHHHHQKSFSIVQPMSVAFAGVGGGATGTESSSEDLNVYNENAEGVGSLMAAPPYGMSSNSNSKKRFRTKFTAEQKERMVEFAERVGWRIQKQDEDEVERFCAEVGVKRQVLRVWMHNNKNTAAVKRMQQQHDNDDITATTGQLALENNNVEAGADQQQAVA